MLIFFILNAAFIPNYAMLMRSKTTSTPKLFPSDCITLKFNEVSDDVECFCVETKEDRSTWSNTSFTFPL